MSLASSMAAWNKPDRWRELCDGTGCPICQRSEPLDIVARLPSSWLTMSEAAPMVGYACLVSQIHAVELHDLSESEVSSFMRDAWRVSSSLASATGAVKLNYEIHGNTLPHLHMHFFPRYRGDMFEGGPIDPNAVKYPVYAAGQFAALRSAVLRGLDESAT
jgi:diadenosine tetraphosphate (Ap4A) HIT family hydrolase